MGDTSKSAHRLKEGLMPTPSPHQVTQLLLAWSDGDAAAQEQLIPLVYGELRRLAKQYMARERPDHTLQASALVNEAYLRLVDSKKVQWENRAHFFAVAAQVMRHILMDFARSRQDQKRGGETEKVSLEEALVVSDQKGADLMELDEALSALASVDLRKSRMVELRFLGGLSVVETAEVLKVSPDTVLRDWRQAKVWLVREMKKTVKSDK
jgi:RNA polymerase sigma factor (TIGR02999 family)